MRTKTVKREVTSVHAGGPAADVGELDDLGFPLLAEQLTCVRWDDGSARETATLLLLAEGGAWKVCLNDRAQRRSLWLSGPTVGACLASLEGALGSGCAAWRLYQPQAGRKSKQ